MALKHHRSTLTVATLLALTVLASSGLQGQQGTRREQRQPTEDGFRFRSGVELINVSATVTDQRGRFVSGLLKEDFSLYEDGQPQNITHFSADRVPVSLGLVLDVSGSMDGEKWSAALNALDRFLFDLLDPADEVFLYTFNSNPDLVQEWTTDRQRISRALGRIRPNGGTAMLDAVSEAVPLADTGRHRKKAVVIISDGNDTASHIDLPELKQLIRETEVMVYAIGIDGRESSVTSGGGAGPRLPIPMPFPVPGRRYPIPPSNPPPTGPTRGIGGGVDVRALRDITDDSGGRTELIRSGRDLVPATTGIADELSQQYYLGYPAAASRDGRWHAIRVDTRDTKLRVRARRGYVATP
jgi:Ca-activated chloride channel homolog